MSWNPTEYCRDCGEARLGEERGHLKMLASAAAFRADDAYTILAAGATYRSGRTDEHRYTCHSAVGSILSPVRCLPWVSEAVYPAADRLGDQLP